MKSATIYRGGTSLYVHSESQTTFGVWVAAPPFIAVPIVEPGLEKGNAVLSALHASTTGVEHPKDWNRVFQPMLELSGSRSWRDFQKRVHCCAVELEGGEIRLIPERRLGPDAGFEPMPEKTIRLPGTSGPEEIAANLDRAFNFGGGAVAGVSTVGCAHRFTVSIDRCSAALEAIASAQSRVEAHLRGTRDSALSPKFDDQIRRFKEMLDEMSAEIAAGRPSPRPTVITRTVADCWPYDSELGKLLTEAERSFTACAERK